MMESPSNPRRFSDRDRTVVGEVEVCGARLRQPLNGVIGGAGRQPLHPSRGPLCDGMLQVPSRVIVERTHLAAAEWGSNSDVLPAAASRDEPASASLIRQ